MKEFVIQYNESGQRFDKYLAKVLPNAPMSFIYKMLRKKNITLNNKKSDGKEKINEGDIIKFFLADDTFEKFASKQMLSNSFDSKNGKPSIRIKKKLLIENSGLKILYEDEDVLIFHKPAGMLSQKAKPSDISVNDYLLDYVSNASTFKPSICNRLDRNTSGIVLCGKSMKGSNELSRLLKDRDLLKYYRCIVYGEASEANLNGFIKKDETTNKVTFRETYFEGSNEIKTSWKPVRTLEIAGKTCTELEVHLITGKTHQIRSHLAAMGHPIAGDYKYGNKKFNDILKKEYGIEHQLLHAYRVVFPNGLDLCKEIDGMEIIDPVPDYFSF